MHPANAYIYLKDRKIRIPGAKYLAIAVNCKNVIV